MEEVGGGEAGREGPGRECWACDTLPAGHEEAAGGTAAATINEIRTVTRAGMMVCRAPPAPAMVGVALRRAVPEALVGVPAVVRAPGGGQCRGGEWTVIWSVAVA